MSLSLSVSGIIGISVAAFIGLIAVAVSGLWISRQFLRANLPREETVGLLPVPASGISKKSYIILIC